MRILLVLAGIATLGCSATKLALVGLSTAVLAQSVVQLAEADAARQKEVELERRHQKSTACCTTKEWVESSQSWRCTACD